MEHLVPIFGEFLVFGIPLVAIIGGILLALNHKKSENEIKKSLIDSKADVEIVKAMLKEPEKKQYGLSFGTLRGGLICIGAGIGIAVCMFLNPGDDLYKIGICAGGVGVGLLVSFIVEVALIKKMQKKEINKQEEVEVQEDTEQQEPTEK